MKLGDEKYKKIDNTNLIKETRNIIKTLTEQERFLKAKSHIEDALRFKNPRAFCDTPL
jgi:hypothetical protein